MPRPTPKHKVVGKLKAAKNSYVAPERIKERKAAGKDVSKERAIVRVGTNTTQILIGEEDVSMWSDEELKQGKRFDKNGQRRGVPPKVVPKVIHDELVRRTLAQANEIMRENLEGAVAVLAAIAKNPKSEDKDRIKAVSIIMDRVMGKTPETVDIKGEVPPWQIALNAGIVSVKGTLLEVEEDPED